MKRLLHTRAFLIAIGIIVLVALASTSFYFYREYRRVQEQLTNPQAITRDEVQKTVDEVARLMMLPEGEVPTLATVSDKDKLTSQPFFANAQNGDKVLIYTNAKKAILYRHATNRIVDVAPVSFGEATPSATPLPKEVRFVLYNGTSIVGLTKSFETTLKDKLPYAVVVDRDNAKKQDYKKSIVVDLAGNNRQTVDIAKTLELDIDTLPAGETKPQGVDFLIILGLDAK